VLRRLTARPAAGPMTLGPAVGRMRVVEGSNPSRHFERVEVSRRAGLKGAALARASPRLHVNPSLVHRPDPCPFPFGGPLGSRSTQPVLQSAGMRGDAFLNVAHPIGSRRHAQRCYRASVVDTPRGGFLKTPEHYGLALILLSGLVGPSLFPIGHRSRALMSSDRRCVPLC
jgi:hypothetical protein